MPFPTKRQYSRKSAAAAREGPARRAGDGQVADRIEQRAVEIEDNQFRIHRTGLLFFRIFHPAAATISDMSGLTRLKTQ